jgi:hypothetical protein
VTLSFAVHWPAAVLSQPRSIAHQSFSIEHINRAANEKSLTRQPGSFVPGCSNQIPVSVFATPSRKKVRLFHPRRDRWADHFVWTDDGTLILGLTAIGRATVEAMQLNRLALVNLRRVLVEAGEHPPEE